MKKLLSAVLALCTMFFVAFGIASCDKQTQYDYSVEELVVKERDSFAPCWFFDFLNQNEHTKEFFSEILSSTMYLATKYRVTVNGETWTAIDFAQKEFPVGFYDIVIESPEGMYLNCLTEDGIEKIPYHKKITLPVFVSNLNEDKYQSKLEQEGNKE